MIVCGIGYGYLTHFTFQRLCKLGATGIGITSQKKYKNQINNIIILNRNEIKESILLSTHLLITAPPQKIGCHILKGFDKTIVRSNIRSVIYISSTGVYGNHNGSWVTENSDLRAKSYYDKIRIKAEKQWRSFCKKNNITLNIIRISGFYGPERIKINSKKKIIILEKKGHFFSRVHILDAARVISKIILESSSSDIWNLSDDNPTSRKDFLLHIMKIKNINRFKVISYTDFEKNLPERSKKFWTNNKKVSNKKIKEYFDYKFIFPSFKNGLLNLKEYL